MSHAVADTVTVVDPRHPLYDQTFPLLHIKNKQELVRSCLVLLTESVERLIPLAVTDLALSPPDVFPVPLDLSSLQNLTQTFSRIAMQLEREETDEASGDCPAKGDAGRPPTGVGNLERPGTESGAADRGPHLPGYACEMGEGGQK
jgi:hypothetical protein